MVMNILDMLPWSQIAAHLQPHARAKLGAEGAVYGAAFGLASAMATSSQRHDAEPLKPILTGMALGLIYGAVDQQLLNNMREN
jgi:ABC-type Fe3+-siderophore transport system permease subunit